MQKKLKLLSIISLSVVTMSLLAGCSIPSADKAENTSKVETVSIQDSMGTTEIPKNPQRIVILTNEGTEALLALGITPVGAVTGFGGDWYDHSRDQLKDTKPLGEESTVNVEAIAALKPDLIIGNKMRQEKIYDQLKAIAPTVFSDTLRGEWQNNFKFYAKAINKEAEAEKVLNNYKAKVASISDIYKDKLDTEISLVRFLDGQTRIYLEDTFAGTILNQIGFQRPEAQKGTDFIRKIGKERINDAEGDVMFYYTYDLGDGKGAAREQEWLNDPVFQSLNVVKNGKAYKVNDTIWNTAGGILAANLMLDDLIYMLKEDKI